MTTWIFLRGLTRESRHWGGFLEQFSQVLPGHSLVALDLPGNGLLNHLTSPINVDDMVESCRAQLAVQGVEPPFHLLAMSLGAMVAVAWAQAYPHEVHVNVLINTSMRPFSPFYQRLRLANYGVLLRLALAGASPANWEQRVLHMTSNRGDESVLPHWLALRHANPVSRLNAFRQLLAAARFQASAERLTMPTLLLASAQDHLVSVESSRAIARHWQCSLRLHPSAGHDLPLDDGRWVAWQVRQWLEDGCRPS
jgi:pimeloyl-ACP methyl ester carboxylesterase